MEYYVVVALGKFLLVLEIKAEEDVSKYQSHHPNEHLD